MNFSNSSVVDCSPKLDDILKSGDDNDNLQLDGSNLFQVIFSCEVRDQNLCDRVEKTLNVAGNIINYALTLRTPIVLDVKFTAMDKKKLGGATPARYISLLDSEDNVERLYPQALVKQLDLPKLSATFTNTDITAQFNSLTNWYIPGDDGAIKSDQYDLLNTVLHEFIHGLGFVSGWRNHIDDALEVPTSGLTGLTPFVITDTSDDDDIPTTTSFKFLGFGETIFDKFVIAKVNGKQTRLSGFANTLNQVPAINQTFVLSDLSAKLQSFPQYNAAKQVLSLSTMKDSLIFMPKGGKSIPNDGIVLETAISPYQAGSSITHVDADIYDGDADFLMRHVNTRGVSMNELVIKSGNRTGSAIGPKLLNILGSIGYNLANNPIKPSFVKSSASILNDQSITIFIFQVTLYMLINHFL